MTYAHIVAVIVKDKFWIVFVNGVVREVHVLFVEICVAGLDILLSGETG